MKWMMGWMHDTLDFSKDTIYRKYHQNELTFSMTYAFTENFMLPLSLMKWFMAKIYMGKCRVMVAEFANLGLLYVPCRNQAENLIKVANGTLKKLRLAFVRIFFSQRN
jgi:hypothetical protein